ncbi:hypothetical protein [Streptomyces venezuelae]|uniref:hypothetical protein n=1 Tax=Streptomyces venezuelae TaxID=54571 RepID=UPI0037D2CD8F
MTGNEPLAPREAPSAGGGAAPDLPGGQTADALRAGPSPSAAPRRPGFRVSSAVPELAAAIRPYLAGDAVREGAPSLGRSLALDDGDLVIDGRSHDLALVAGADALGQALELAVATQTGSDPLNVRFGFDRLAISAYADDLTTRKEFLTMELVRCLSTDLRVTDVREVFYDDDPRYRELLPGLDDEAHRREIAAAHAARLYTVYAVVDTVANTPVTLRARGTP